MLLGHHVDRLADVQILATHCVYVERYLPTGRQAALDQIQLTEALIPNTKDQIWRSSLAAEYGSNVGAVCLSGKRAVNLRTLCRDFAVRRRNSPRARDDWQQS